MHTCATVATSNTASIRKVHVPTFHGREWKYMVHSCPNWPIATQEVATWQQVDSQVGRASPSHEMCSSQRARSTVLALLVGSFILIEQARLAQCYPPELLDSADTLTKDEESGVLSYEATPYGSINELLRWYLNSWFLHSMIPYNDGIPAEVSLVDIGSRVSAALNKLSPVDFAKAARVYPSVKIDQPYLYRILHTAQNNFGADWIPGHLYLDGGFTSTSFNRRAITDPPQDSNRFFQKIMLMGPHYFFFQISPLPHGSRGRSLVGVGAKNELGSSEEEVLFLPGVYFCILSREQIKIRLRSNDPSPSRDADFLIIQELDIPNENVIDLVTRFGEKVIDGAAPEVQMAHSLALERRATAQRMCRDMVPEPEPVHVVPPKKRKLAGLFPVFNSLSKRNRKSRKPAPSA